MEKIDAMDFRCKRLFINLNIWRTYPPDKSLWSIFQSPFMTKNWLNYWIRNTKFCTLLIILTDSFKLYFWMDFQCNMLRLGFWKVASLYDMTSNQTIIWKIHFCVISQDELNLSRYCWSCSRCRWFLDKNW